MLGTTRLAHARHILAAGEAQLGIDPVTQQRAWPDSSRSATASGARAGTTSAWQVPEGFSSLFPSGIPRGSVIPVRGARVMLFFVLGLLSQQGAWIVALGFHDARWVAARHFGVDEDRTVWIPTVDPRRCRNVLSVAMNADVVALGSDLDVSADFLRNLQTYARGKKVVLVLEQDQSRTIATYSAHSATVVAGGHGEVPASSFLSKFRIDVSVYALHQLSHGRGYLRAISVLVSKGYQRIRVRISGSRVEPLRTPLLELVPSPYEDRKGK
ncbi:MAG: hypothetical protein SPI12_05125 [Actinomycetaceae bacterium]|nr:hypothetical protein [Actinomycetaceae bacterium]MDY6083226.1 hypothetical protein [Actinomycetaceae bacterium]